MRKRNVDKGMTLVEVMIALAIIVGIVMIAYQYHATLMLNNGELLQTQEQLLSDENLFDQSYQVES
ncbi:MAG: prepilin-type N-terminal cleavage/methylation domain-containing protein [Wohlfahrtiimonas sp.]